MSSLSSSPEYSVPGSEGSTVTARSAPRTPGLISFQANAWPPVRLPQLPVLAAEVLAADAVLPGDPLPPPRAVEAELAEARLEPDDPRLAARGQQQTEQRCPLRTGGRARAHKRDESHATMSAKTSLRLVSLRTSWSAPS